MNQPLKNWSRGKFVSARSNPAVAQQKNPRWAPQRCQHVRPCSQPFQGPLLASAIRTFDVEQTRCLKVESPMCVVFLSPVA